MCQYALWKADHTVLELSLKIELTEADVELKADNLSK